MHSIKPLMFYCVLTVIACGCSNGDSDKPYLEFAGGGFIFNYRLATADYGFVARVVRKLPAGTILEAEFEDPGGGEPITIRQNAQPNRLTYKFETPPVTGVKAHEDYRVELRLIDSGKDKIIARYTKTFRSNVDQKILPAKPPVVGPGYQSNPEAAQ